MTQAGNLYNDYDDLTVKMAVARAVELGEILKSLSPVGAGYSPSGPIYPGPIYLPPTSHAGFGLPCVRIFGAECGCFVAKIGSG